MPKEPELKARDKVVLRMKREGAVEENLRLAPSSVCQNGWKMQSWLSPLRQPSPPKLFLRRNRKRCRCAVSSISFRRNTPKITTHSRPRKRPSQTKKRQKIHPRMYLNRCPRKRRSSPQL